MDVCVDVVDSCRPLDFYIIEGVGLQVPVPGY